MYVQPLAGTTGPDPLSSLADTGGASGTALGMLNPATAGDDITRFLPPPLAGAANSMLGGNTNSMIGAGLLGPLTGMLQQLMAMMQQMMSYFTGSGNLGSGNLGSQYPISYPGSGSTSSASEPYFQNAIGGSNGDPHLSFNGSTWNDMCSQPNLLCSNSFPGGFQISTQTTPPGQNGVTYNQSATVSLNGGMTSVSMNNAGQATITECGQATSIAPGQSLQLGNGTTVTDNNNGSLTVVAQNGYGGQISTTMTPRGQGVNVDVNAQNVDLGGALVNGSQSGYQTPSPIPTPPTPIAYPPLPTQYPMPQPPPPPVTPIYNPINRL